LLGVDESVTLVGPYERDLGNDGGVVRLMKPVAAATANAGFILVDQVAYDDQSPWPVKADGDGNTLNRAGIHTFGNSATSWLVLPPTGGLLPERTRGDVNADGSVDTADADAFARILANPAAHQAAYGWPATMAADLDGDGDVDSDDIGDLISVVEEAGLPAAARYRLARAHQLPTDERRSHRAAAWAERSAQQNRSRLPSMRDASARRGGGHSALTDRVLAREVGWLDDLTGRVRRRGS
jgi:hypothetical protein